MPKRIVALAIPAFLLNTVSLATTPITYPAYVKTPVVAYADSQNIIHIVNNTQKTIQLNHAQIAFYFDGSIQSLSLNHAEFSLINHVASPKLPNAMGDFYRYQITSDKPIVLKPQSNLAIAVNGKSLTQTPVHGIQILSETLVPVQAQFSVSTVDSNTTISICNNSPYSIPLTNLELDFNYAGAITSVWGSPWLDWQPTSENGQYTLLGGSQYQAPYEPDPNCKTPITVTFTATQGAPDPSTFTLKSAGGTPMGYGSLKIHVDQIDQSGLPDPTITINGMGITEQQTVKWGRDWIARSLVPGDYTITASAVDNSQIFYQATVTPASTEVLNNESVPVDVSYQQVPTGVVHVTLNNAPATTEPVLFSGTHASYMKTLPVDSNTTLPQDNYVVTSSVPGYSAAITPSSFTLDKHAAVSIAYDQVKIKNYVGYFESWTDSWANSPDQTKLAQVPTYVNYVMLSFMKPDAVYTAGSLDFTDTGIQFGYSGQMLKEAINDLRVRNPNVKILVSVGGATYPNWGALNTQAIADFVQDFGLDGVDVDYEIDPGCSVGGDKLVHCAVDQQYSDVVSAFRKALPRPYLVTMASWSTGAYGEDQWAAAQPGGSHTGEALPLLRTNSQDFDLINVMSYDAGLSFDPNEALAAYQHYFNGPIAMGVEVPPEAWGGHVYTLPAVADLTSAVLQSASQTGNPPGMMIWALQIKATGTPSADNPSAEMMSKQICGQMGLEDCDQAWNL